MNFLGYNINVTKAIAENKFVRNTMLSWGYGRPFADIKDQTALLNAYESWVYICASLNSATFASTPLRMYVAIKEKNTPSKGITRKIPLSDKKEILSRSHIASKSAVMRAVDVEEVTDHRFLDTLSAVNPFMNKNHLFELSNIYQELTGNAYWYLVKDSFGMVIEIWPIPPDRMKVVPSRENFISHYIYQYGATKVPFEIDEIVHFKWPNPKSLFYGASPLQAVSQAFNTNQNMGRFENAMFANNARPEGFFTTEQDIDDDSFDRVKEELQQTYLGVSNTGKVGFLDKGVTFSPVTMKPKDLSFLKGREWTMKEIYNAYGVPIGLFDDKANRANAEAAQYVYAKYGIQPRHARFEEKLNEQILNKFDEKLFVAFDNVVPEDKAFELEEDVQLLGAGSRTINEVRMSRGKEKIDGGNEPLVNRGLVPLSQIGMIEEGSDEAVVEEMVNEVFDKIMMDFK